MWPHVIAAALGFWLMAAPSVLGYRGLAMHNDHIVGPLAATFAITAWWQCTRAVRWVNVILGAWMIVAPWVLGADALPAKLNGAMAGGLLAGFSLIKGRTDKRFAGGWRALFRSEPGKR